MLNDAQWVRTLFDRTKVHAGRALFLCFTDVVVVSAESTVVSLPRHTAPRSLRIIVGGGGG